jgi:hypothetical protein
MWFNRKGKETERTSFMVDMGSGFPPGTGAYPNIRLAQKRSRR